MNTTPACGSHKQVFFFADENHHATLYSMADQWFLDLDGVRSGPYQTPEVMALVAEGEVLPHHRISRGLKDQTWVSILDWRLEQAKASATKTAQAPTRKATPPKPEAPPIPAQPQQPTTPVAPKEPPVQIEKPVEKKAAPPSFEPPPAAPVDMSADQPKRDPTAEMFEMLQNTKQRREKQNLRASGITVEPDTKGPIASSSPMKTVLVGIGIICLGFGLGQLFQSSRPPESTVREVKVTPTPAIKPERKTEVVDRSNEKMIIRSKIERNMRAAATPSPTLKPRATPQPEPPHTAAVEKRVNEKELEELRDLKRELLELKALKEQMNTQQMNNTQQMFPEAGMDMNNPGADMDEMPPGGVQGAQPFPGEVPQGNPEQEVHY